jgi:pimeloyl-ACP methyl ester carboxylesterase
MSLLLASEHPELVDGAILSALSHKRHLNPRLCWAGDVVNQVVKPNVEMSLAPYSLPYISSNLILTDNYAKDPMIRHKMKVIDLIKVDHLNKKAIARAKQLPSNFPLLIICGQKDGLFKSSELPNAVKQFGTHNVSLHILPNEGHLLLEYQTVNPRIAAIVTSWLQQQTPPPSHAAKPMRQVNKGTKQTAKTDKKQISSRR